MRRGLLIVAVALLLGAGFAASHRWFNNQYGDPDRWYHFALSRQMVETGTWVPRTIPQVEGLGWNENFTDKEFLFHQLTRAGYALGGDRGVIWAALLGGVLALMAFFWFAASRVPVPAAALLAYLTFSSPLILSRLMLVRPHTLAVLTFLLMNLAILAARPFLTLLGVALFVLSYHAFYLPLLCLGWLAAVAFVLTKGEERARWLRVASFGAFGSVCGVLLNPYFPGNLVLGWIHARIPQLMKTELSHLHFGMELYPARADEFLAMFAGPLFVLLVGGVFTGTQLRRPRPGAEPGPVALAYLLGTTTMFTLMGFQVIRAGEYLIPSAGLLLVCVGERWRSWRWPEYAVLVLLAFVQTGFNKVFLQGAFMPYDSRREDHTVNAVKAIPADAKGAKVFNCEWDRTPYLLYHRPDIRFLDILDPSLYYFHDRNGSQARSAFEQGTATDAYGLVRNAFKADFVLCENLGMVRQMRRDPGFEMLYPNADTNGASPRGDMAVLFRVKKEGNPFLLHSYDLLQATGGTAAEMQAISPPKQPPAKPEHFDLSYTSYLNLLSSHGNASPNTAYRCAIVAPGADELKKLAGAEALALGGGQGFRVWRNGVPLFHTLVGFDRTQSTQVVLPLEPPLKANDRLEVLVCSEAGAKFWGVALSLYRRDQLTRLCGPGAAKPGQAAWLFRDIQNEACVGAWAIPEVRSAR